MNSVTEMLRQQVAQRPDNVALWSGDQSVTYHELWKRVVTTACYLSDTGVRPGSRVLLSAPSTPAFACSYFATHLAGGVAVPLDPLAPASRRNDIIERTQPVLAITASAEDVLPCPSVRIDDLEKLEPQERNFDPVAPETLADLIFTTGTTGRPKGVRLTHGNLAAAVSHINSVIGTDSNDVEVVPIPLYHSFGLGRIRCCLSVGATAVLVQGFRLPGEIFTALDRHQATGMVGVPAGFAILLRFGERGIGAFANRLRYIEIGSAPMPLEHKTMLMHLLPSTSLFMHYGLTEASRSAFIEFHRHSAHLATSGRSAPGVKLEVRDENGIACSVDQAGMLWVSGPHVSSGYWDNPELDSVTFENGWLRTGDVAHIDEAGFVCLHGREDDMVNVGGFNVSPEEVEQVLARHAAVAEVACVGIADPRGIAGQVLCAYLVPMSEQIPVADSELSNLVKEQLELYKIPAQYEWVSKLPRTASGKLLRAELRALSASNPD